MKSKQIKLTSKWLPMYFSAISYTSKTRNDRIKGENTASQKRLFPGLLAAWRESWALWWAPGAQSLPKARDTARARHSARTPPAHWEVSHVLHKG